MKTQSTTQAARSLIERVVQCFGRAGILYARLTGFTRLQIWSVGGGGKGNYEAQCL